MSLRLPNSCFIHVPRTGGLWLGELLHQNQVKVQVLKGDIDSHFTYSQLPDRWRNLTSFSFIRQPYDWAFSRWSHAIKHHTVQDWRHEGIHREFDELVGNSFQKTVRNILRKSPGLVTRTFNEMQDGVDYLIRTEDLPNEAISLIECLEGVKLETIPEAFNGTTEAFLPYKTLPTSLFEDFMSSEKEILLKWESLITVEPGESA